MFTGVNFVFDDIPSEKYGLKIGFLNGSGVRDSYSGINQEIEEVKIKRVDKPVFFGIERTGKVAFEILVFSEEEIDTYDRQAIDRWLFQNEYKYFQIEQDDYNGLFFNCVMKSSNKVEVGNTPYMKRIMVECDSPYVYTDEYIYSYTSTTTPTNYNITNLSNLNQYSYPEVVITMTTNGSATITNNTDGTSTIFTGLLNNEVLTIDNGNKILDSSTEQRRMSNFNKVWTRLLPDINNITLSGNFTIQIKIRYRKTI